MGLFNFLKSCDLTDYITGEKLELNDHLLIKEKCMECEGSGVNRSYYCTVNSLTKIQELVCPNCKGKRYITKAIELVELESAIKTWIISEITKEKTEFGEAIRKSLVEIIVDS